MNRAPFTIAILLGIAGLIPFLGGLAVIITDPTRAPARDHGDDRLRRLHPRLLGAVHWGFALEPGGIVPEARLNNQRLLFGVLPALVGWGRTARSFAGAGPAPRHRDPDRRLLRHHRGRDGRP
uniref:DUF3429 domain-containing protein n=1 Tax=Acidocella sp. C78 TaxID=1671486 RepID=UPI0020BE2714